MTSLKTDIQSAPFVSFDGTILTKTSSLGTAVYVLDGPAQTVSSAWQPQPDGIWLSMAMEGSGSIRIGAQNYGIAAKDIVYGRRLSAHPVFDFHTAFRQLLLLVPPVVIAAKLVEPIGQRIGHLRPEASITRVFSDMLAAFATSIETMMPEEITPVELSLGQFLVSCISSQDKRFPIGGAAATRATHLHHIRQTIEAMLGNPALDTRLIAKHEGVSVRYVQKLFSASGQTFAKYVHDRRLERCRQDLLDPAQSELTITDICFQWGFNSSAHFSRAFRRRYGISPRQFRLDQAC